MKKKVKNSKAKTRKSLLINSSEWVCDMLHLDKGKTRLDQELTALGSGRKGFEREYYVKKISNVLLVGFFALSALIIVLCLECRQDPLVKDGLLDRPGYGEGESSEIVNLSIVGSEESEDEIVVSVNARIYTSSQVEQLLRDAEEELVNKLPGDNDSLDEVRSALILPNTLQSGTVSAEYYITPSGMIGDDGSITGSPEENGTIIDIETQLACQKKERTFHCAAKIYPPILSKAEQLKSDIDNAIKSAESEDPSSPVVKLPETVDGLKLIWSYPKSSSFRMIVFLLMLLPPAIWIRSDSKVHEAARKRDTQLELDYSQLLWKLTMLLSAGLTIRGAFSRIVYQYLEERDGQISDKRNKRSHRWFYPLYKHKLRIPVANAGRGIDIVRSIRLRPAYDNRCNSRASTAPSRQTADGVSRASGATYRMDSSGNLNPHSSSTPGVSTSERRYGSFFEGGKKDADRDNHTLLSPGKMSVDIANDSKRKRYVYEEMLLTLREMRSGTPEASAYENFGRRCALPAYIKLGSLLAQNLEKGSRGLTSLLEHEALMSMEQHKMTVRRIGEQASVKILLPMILMLGVVLTILTAPAFLSM